MVAWMLGVFAAPMVLAGFGVYLCRRPRRHRRLTVSRSRGQAPGTAAMASPAPGSADLVTGGSWRSRSPGPAANGSSACGTGSGWN
jgi:hypothetical protein